MNWSTFGRWRPPPHHRQKGNLCAFSAIWCSNVLLLAAADAQREFYSA
jgi:hypothetical protein